MPVALGALAVGAAMGLGEEAENAGRNDRHAGSFQETKFYDPEATLYGGRRGGLQDYNANLNYRRGLVEDRGPNLADEHQANWDRHQSHTARLQQGQAADLMMRRAQGQTPSIAQMQAGHQIGMLQQGGAREAQAAIAAQASAAASARGQAAMALAQQNAANNTANAQSAIARSTADATANISGQAQVNAAQERLAAEQAAFGAYSGMRGGDQTQEQIAAQRAQFQAGQHQINRDSNDRRAMGYEQLEGQANTAAMQAAVGHESTLAQSHGQAETHNAETAQRNADKRKGVFGAIMGGAGKASGMMSSDTEAKEPLPMSSMASMMPMLMQGGGGGAASAGGGAMPMLSRGGAGGAGAGAAMLSDTRAKEQALIERGRKQGIALASGGRAGTRDDRARIQDMLDDRYAQHEARRPDGDTLGRDMLDREIANRVERDAADERINAELARQSRDPAVWLGSAPKGYARMRNPQSDVEHARFAELAPGTEDWERTQPKPRQEGPWWVSPPKSWSMLSDENAKRQAFLDGVRHTQQTADTGVVPAFPEYLAEGRRKPRQPDVTSPRMLERTLPSEHDARAPSTTKPDAHIRVGRRAAIDEGPVAQANRTLVGSPYAYKPEHTPPSQVPGEPNFGPMAQNLERTPVGATAVKLDPGSGMRVIDRDKMMKVVASGVADLQRQQDETRLMLAKGGKNRR